LHYHKNIGMLFLARETKHDEFIDSLINYDGIGAGGGGGRTSP
jgi:hypothetical protein